MSLKTLHSSSKMIFCMNGFLFNKLTLLNSVEIFVTLLVFVSYKSCFKHIKVEEKLKTTKEERIFVWIGFHWFWIPICRIAIFLQYNKPN